MPPPETLVKLMSLDADEFRRSLAKFAPETLGTPGKNEYLLGDDGCGLHVSIEELTPFSPGGLIILPQCRIILRFHGYSPEQRAQILARFDRVFFRGGG